MSAPVARVVLPGGIRVVCEPMDHVRSVAVGFWVEAGGLFEEKPEHGVAHLLEHVAFKGTTRRTSRQIARDIEGRGGLLGGFTEKEFCCYYAVVLDAHLAVAVDVLADILLHHVCDEEKLAKEKAVVLEEISDLEDSPEDLVHELAAEGVWPDHPMGSSLLGSRESVSLLTCAHVRSFWRRRYTPSTLTVAAAGRVEPEHLCALVQRWVVFSDNGQPQGQPDPLPPRQMRLVCRQRDLAQVHLLVATRTDGVRADTRFDLSVLNAVLGGGMGSRLFQTVREQHGLAYSVYSHLSQLKDTGMLGVYVAADPSRVEEATALLAQEVASLCAEGVGPEELQEAKEQIKGSLVLSQESTSARMTRLATHELYFGTHMDLDETLRAIDEVTGERVVEVARRVFLDQELTVAMVGPLEHEPGALRETLEAARARIRQV